MAKTAKTPPASGRKAKYVARNRQSIILATQELLAEKGPLATVDEVAENAGVAVSTLYMHFPSKDELFQEAIQSAFMEWELWMREQTLGTTNKLEQLVLPMRLFVRAKESHPLYGALVAKNMEFVSQILPILTMQVLSHVNDLVDSGHLKITDTAIRVQNLMSIIVAQLGQQLSNPKANPESADRAIEFGLAMLGISPSVAKKLTTSKLPI